MQIPEILPKVQNYATAVEHVCTGMERRLYAPSAAFSCAMQSNYQWTESSTPNVMRMLQESDIMMQCENEEEGLAADEPAQPEKPGAHPPDTWSLTLQGNLPVKLAAPPSAQASRSSSRGPQPPSCPPPSAKALQAGIGIFIKNLIINDKIGFRVFD
jgi:hypothetical protein